MSRNLGVVDGSSSIPCDSAGTTVAEKLQELGLERECIWDESSVEKFNETYVDTPIIDIFLNPPKKLNRDFLEESHQNKSKEFFTTVNKDNLYPALFRLLWFSSIPCTQEQSVSEEFMV